MTQSIHAHTVMEMAMSAAIPPTFEQLKQALTVEFGEDARFHSCAASDMTIDEMLEFLISMGKLPDAEGKMQSGMCGCG